MTKTVIFYSRSLQNRLYPLIAKQITKFNSVHIVQNEEEGRVVKSIIPDAKIYDLTNYIKSNWDNDEKLNSISLGFIEETYKINSLWKLYYVDRFLVKYCYEDSVKFIKLHYFFIKMIIDDIKPVFFINEEVAMFSAFLFLKICKKHECKYLGFSVPRNFTYDKFLFTQDEYSHYYELDAHYQGNTITTNDIALALSNIKKIRETAIKPEYMLVQGAKPKFSLIYFWSLLKSFFYLLFEKKDYFNYVKRKKSVTQLNGLKFYLRYLMQKRYYKKPLENQKYLLFPLHFQPESSTLTKATDFENQINTIEIIAKNLPGDYVLYVKEHYAKLGHREMSFYKLIQKFCNVRFIDPWIDSHSLIKKSEGVIVLTSTVGWEALIYRKPVFILGNVFYETFRYSVKIDNIYKLAEIIKDKLHERQISENDYDYELAKYFASYTKAMKEGSYYLKLKPDAENVKILALELEKELENSKYFSI